MSPRLLPVEVRLLAPPLRAAWQTVAAASLVDAAILRAAEQLTYSGCLGDEVSLRFHLPARCVCVFKAPRNYTPVLGALVSPLGTRERLRWHPAVGYSRSYIIERGGGGGW